MTIDVEQFRSRSIFIVGEGTVAGEVPDDWPDVADRSARGCGFDDRRTRAPSFLLLRPRSANPAQPHDTRPVDQANVTRLSLADLQQGRLSRT